MVRLMYAGENTAGTQVHGDIKHSPIFLDK